MTNMSKLLNFTNWGGTSVPLIQKQLQVQLLNLAVELLQFMVKDKGGDKMEELKNTYYVLLNDEGRITLLTVERQSDEQIAFDFPQDFNPSEIIDYKIVDGELVYDKFIPPAPILTPEEQREQTYRTEPIIEWQGEMITVDAANDLWVKYSAEGSEVANQLSALIVEAKKTVREQYPNEE